MEKVNFDSLLMTFLSFCFPEFHFDIYLKGDIKAQIGPLK